MYGCLCNLRRASRGEVVASRVSLAELHHSINDIFLRIFCCAKFLADELAGEEFICHQRENQKIPRVTKQGQCPENDEPISHIVRLDALEIWA